MKQVINVISMKSGLIIEIKSFIFNINNDQEERTVVNDAEQYYLNKVNQFNTDYTINDANDDGFVFSNHNGSEVLLIWSI